jgi:hypothetical protein
MPAGASAQVFLSSRPRADFTIGPLIVRAAVAPEREEVTVEISFSLVVAPDVSGADVDQDIHLVWPGPIGTGSPENRPDPKLRAFVEERGFTAVGGGSVPLRARDIYAGRPSDTVIAQAPFVMFMRERGANGTTAPATWIRLPWRPEMINRARLVALSFTSNELVKVQPATWLEETFRGRRNTISLTFHEMRARGLFPLYLEHRDRVIRLADEPSQLSIRFARADRLQIDSVAPPAASRRASETGKSMLVSRFLDRSEGLAPQELTVDFGYFSGLQSWMPILIPTLFFLLGNLAAVFVRHAAERLSRALAGRFQFLRRGRAPERESGTLVTRDALARIEPGTTTREDVQRLLGASAEERERFDGSSRSTLIYQGRRLVPRQHRRFGWFATVDHWDVEHHEVEIELEHDRVRDVQARVRRSRM